GQSTEYVLAEETEIARECVRGSGGGWCRGQVRGRVIPHSDSRYGHAWPKSSTYQYAIKHISPLLVDDEFRRHLYLAICMPEAKLLKFFSNFSVPGMPIKIRTK